MTELQFLIHLITKHKLPTAVKDLCIERMGEVEEKLSKKNDTVTGMIRPGEIAIGGGSQQSASTIAAMARQEMNIPPPPVQNAALPAQMPKEVVTGGGNMTSIRGPNKMRGRL